MPAQFEGKVAVVTGAAGGIGRACALAFAREGAKVVVSDVREQEGEETVSLIKTNEGEASFVKADVSSAQDVKAMVEHAAERYGRLDYAVNNAGMEGPRARVAEYSEADWIHIVNVNLIGVWLCMKYELSEMMKLNRGAVVNMASAAGLVGLKKFSAYSASKHGVIGLTKSAALEYFQYGIRVNAVCPGLIDTDMVDRAILKGGKAPESAVERMIHSVKKSIGSAVMSAKLPSGRMGTVQEIAEAAVWLCSDQASFVNGHAMAVDGGFVIK